MSAASRLAAFAAVLALAFGGAALAGAAIDPTDADDVAADAGHGGSEQSSGAHGDGEQPPESSGTHGGGHESAEAKPTTRADASATSLSGLTVSEGGYALELDRTFFAARQTAPLAFRITDARGRVVRGEFEVEHDKRMHVIVVRRDTAVFEHVHPRQAADGTWSVNLNLREPGTYRVYTDFKIGGEKRTLASDVFVPGAFSPNTLPKPATTDRAVDTEGRPAGGIDVALRAPGLRAGRETSLTFAATKDEQPFEALEPYLGAKGHLVALREGDLAYLHSHPAEDDAKHGHGSGATSTEAHANETKFAATFPTAGRYRLFLQFKTGGDVRTVAYTLEVPR